MASSNSSEPELSREEAIKVLEMFLHKQCSLGRTEFAYDVNTVWEAVKMAAESLKTDEAYQLEYGSTTKNNLGVDCIDRDRTLNVLDAEAWAYIDYIKKDIGGNMDSHICMFADNVRERLKELPPVTPQPRKGHWTCDRANVRCSNCGRGYKDFYGKARIADYNYCPNCGAKMVEPQESEVEE